MEKPHIDTTAVEVPADLASPALYRVDAAYHPRVDRAEMLRYLGYGGQQIEPELSRRIELVVERLELDIEPRGVRRAFAEEHPEAVAEFLSCHADRGGPRGWATGCEGNPIGPHPEFGSAALVLPGIPKYYPADRIPHLTPMGRRKTNHFVAELVFRA